MVSIMNHLSSRCSLPYVGRALDWLKTVDYRRRHVVPRWWPLQVAAELGQLDSAIHEREAGLPEPKSGELDELQDDWKKHRTPFNASSLVDAALVLGRPPCIRRCPMARAKCGVSKISQVLANRVLALAEISKSNTAHTMCQMRSRLMIHTS